jgi:REP element-mobilizing transposase RayT
MSRDAVPGSWQRQQLYHYTREKYPKILCYTTPNELNQHLSCEKKMGSYRQIYYQIVFGTKYRKPTINPLYEDDLFRYIWGLIKNKRGKLYRINGIEDHIHIMSDLHPSISLADFVKDIKVSTSLWMKSSGKFPLFEGWQDGYGAFTYSIRERDMIINYIKKQKRHHHKESFYDEYKRLMEEHGIEFDEKYLL